MSKQLTYGLIALVFILVWSYFESSGDIIHFFKSSARLSGRVSLVFFGIFFFYSVSQSKKLEAQSLNRNHFELAKNFALVHAIHWFLLAGAIYFGKTPLEFVRVLGGFLAYIMIIILPFSIYYKWVKASNWRWVSNIYFHYVWLIFTLTYVARLSGKAPFATGTFYSYTFFAFCTIVLLFWSILIRFSKAKN